MTPDNIPIACTLSAGDYHARMEWLSALNDRALASHWIDGLTLRLRYRDEALSDVQELVRRETACCAFLSFDVHHSDGLVELAISAPPEPEAAAATLFDVFIRAGRNACASACTCA
jgi:hypothetical protein